MFEGATGCEGVLRECEGVRRSATGCDGVRECDRVLGDGG